MERLSGMIIGGHKDQIVLVSVFMAGQINFCLQLAKSDVGTRTVIYVESLSTVSYSYSITAMTIFAVSTQYTNVTASEPAIHTDRQTPQGRIGCAYATVLAKIVSCCTSMGLMIIQKQ